MKQSSTAAQYEAFQERRVFGSLDGLRCVSILAVIWHHSHGTLQVGRIGTRGFLGVDMFFVLSGFLIVTLLLRERERNGKISLKSFYARRTLRIMPLYYAVVLGSTALFLGLRPGGATAQSLRESLPYLLTYTTNWVVVGGILDITWSLAAEEQFYLLWPPVQKYVRRPLIVLSVLILFSQLIQFGLLDTQLAALGFGPNDVPMLRQITFTPILLGVLLAHVLHAREGFGLMSSLLGHRMAPLVISLALVVFLELAPADLRGWPRITIHLMITALLASVVIDERHVLTPLLDWCPVVRIGVLSYGMYLLHMFVVHITGALAEGVVSRYFAFPATALLTWVAAEVSYRYYETPFLRLKKRFSR